MSSVGESHELKPLETNVIDTVRDAAGRTLRFVIAAALSLGVLAAQAPDVAQAPDASAAKEKKLLLWMDNSFSGLYGAGFKIDDGDQGSLIFEHVSGWSFGDLYTFFSQDWFVNPTGDDGTSWYGEFSPRLSLGKILGKDLSFSIFGQDLVVWKDTLIAMTYERGRHSGLTESLLLGVGFDVDLSAFGVLGDRTEYFQVNVFARNELNDGAGDDPDRGFEDLQITVVAAVQPLEIGQAKILIDFFIDFVAGWGPQAQNFHFSPQIKLDIGNFWGKPRMLYFGVDIDIWTNKYGLQGSDAFDTDQVAASALVKFHF